MLTRRLPVVCMLAGLLGACGFSSPEREGYLVGGTVRGLWDGAEKVELQLQGDGIDAIVVVSPNGAFGFPQQLGSGTSYMVTVATSPAQHSCVVEAAQAEW